MKSLQKVALRTEVSGFNALPYLHDLMEMAEQNLVSETFKFKEVARMCINSCQRDINRILSGENIVIFEYRTEWKDVEIPDDLPF